MLMNQTCVFFMASLILYQVFIIDWWKTHEVIMGCGETALSNALFSLQEMHVDHRDSDFNLVR